MWKKFIYSERERVAYIPPEGPAFQVLDAGKPVKGFRAFHKDKMKDVQPTENLFSEIPVEIVEEYPELKLAMHQ